MSYLQLANVRIHGFLQGVGGAVDLVGAGAVDVVVVGSSDQMVQFRQLLEWL